MTFRNGDSTCVVPGYYAADGNAANTSATSGNIRRVHFCGDKTGRWTYEASFKGGPHVAVQGGSICSLGNPPKDNDKDWAILVRSVDPNRNQPPAVDAGEDCKANAYSPALIEFEQWGHTRCAESQRRQPVFVE